MARVADHPSVADLERRFRGCPDPIEARHRQVIWLLAQGHTIGATSKVTSFGSRWIGRVLERHEAHRREDRQRRRLSPAASPAGAA